MKPHETPRHCERDYDEDLGMVVPGGCLLPVARWVETFGGDLFAFCEAHAVEAEVLSRAMRRVATGESKSIEEALAAVGWCPAGGAA